MDALTMGTFLTLLEGDRFEFFEDCEIPLAAILRGLAREQRFARQTWEYWPVTCHLLVTMSILEELGATRLEIVGGGIHDAEEALLGDVPTPLKAILRVALPSGEIVGYEEGIGRPTRAKCIASLGLPPELLDVCASEVVKRADRIALHAEGAVLHRKILPVLGELPETDRPHALHAEAGIRGILRTLKAGGLPDRIWHNRLRAVRDGHRGR